MKSPAFIEWKCGKSVLNFGDGRTRVMGVLNVTPDSFSDGGAYFDAVRAIQHGVRLAEEGADIIDVGGESTRPGAEPVPLAEEMRRVIPVIRELAARTRCLISVDTTKPGVAAAAIAAGASILNDVSAMTADPGMVELARKSRVGVVLMHMKGTPKTMQLAPTYENVVEEVSTYLEQRVKALVDAGIEPERIAVDPGIGFGKTVDHNLALLVGLPRLARLWRPIVLGLSRKSFIGKITGREVGERLPGSIAAAAYAVLRGAQVIRAHDVKETCDALRLVDMLHAEQRRYERTD